MGQRKKSKKNWLIMFVLSILVIIFILELGTFLYQVKYSHYYNLFAPEEGKDKIKGDFSFLEKYDNEKEFGGCIEIQTNYKHTEDLIFQNKTYTLKDFKFNGYFSKEASITCKDKNTMMHSHPKGNKTSSNCFFSESDILLYNKRLKEGTSMYSILVCDEKTIVLATPKNFIGLKYELI